MSRGRLALLALPIAGISCSDRDRPGILHGEVVQLAVEVLAPRTQEQRLIVAGTSMNIEVRAHESGGRLVGIGYEASQPADPRVVLDSARILFSPVQSRTQIFVMVAPDSLPQNAQIVIVGIAYGAGAVQIRSRPETVLIMKCPPGAIWCR
jgi:hypothetical protein